MTQKKEKSLPPKAERFVYTYPPFKEALQQKDFSILHAVAKEIGGIGPTSKLSKDDLVEFIFNSIVNENKFDVLFKHIALLDQMSYDSLEETLRHGGLVVHGSSLEKGELAVFNKSFFVHIRPDEWYPDNEYVVDFPQEIRKIIKKNRERLEAIREPYDTLNRLVDGATEFYGVITVPEIMDLIRYYHLQPLLKWGRNKILKVLRHRDPDEINYFYQTPYFANAELKYVDHDPKKAINFFLGKCLNVPLWYPPSFEDFLEYTDSNYFFKTERFEKFYQFILDRFMRRARDMDGLMCGFLVRLNRSEPIEKIARDFETYRTRPEQEGDHDELLRRLRALEENSRLRPRRGHTVQELQKEK